MRLRTRLIVLSVSTVAVIVAVLLTLQFDELTRAALENALDRSNLTGHQIESFIVQRITDVPAADAAPSLAQTKRNWTRIVAGDKDIAALLVESAAIRAGVIVEINIVGEDGNVLVSSIPSRQGHPAPVHESLATMSSSGSFARLSAITSSATDYETRVSLGIPDQQKPVFEIQLVVSPVLFKDKVRPDLAHTAVFSLFALLAAAGLAGISANLALRPVRRISKALDTLALGKPLGLSLPTEAREDSEVAAVEYKLGLLGEQMQGARRDADQMRTAIGSLVRGVAHEIKNPLNAIALRLETLRMRIADEIPEAEADLDLVSNEVHRLDRVVRTFLDLNRPMELDWKEFDPVELASVVLEILRPAATQAKAELHLTKPSRPFTVHADRGLIEQALLNVVNNAIQAIGSGGQITTTISQVDGDCEITVTDNGPGMPPEVCQRVFEPYFTTKATGSGIGLAFTKRAMELHHGHIAVASSPGHGTTMTLTFPIARSQA